MSGLRPRGGVREFERILDRCVDELIGGGATTLQAASRAGDLAFEVRPLLEAGAELHAVTEPLPYLGPAARSELMARVRWTPQQRAASEPPPGLVRVALPLAGLAAVLALALLIGAGRPDEAYASTLTILAGRVERQVGESWEELTTGARVFEGERLRTSPDAAALLTLPDGSTVELERGTLVTVGTGSVPQPVDASPPGSHDGGEAARSPSSLSEREAVDERAAPPSDAAGPLPGSLAGGGDGPDWTPAGAATGAPPRGPSGGNSAAHGPRQDPPGRGPDAGHRGPGQAEPARGGERAPGPEGAGNPQAVWPSPSGQSPEREHAPPARAGLDVPGGVVLD